MAIVTADIVDENGNRVIHATNQIGWSVEGAATLIGPELYKTDYNLFESMEGTGYIHPPVSNIIRSANRPGKAKITVSSPGLKPASVEIDVIPMEVGAPEIIQPVLSEDGRKKVYRDDNIIFELKEVNELLPISGNRTFAISNEKKLLQDIIDFLEENNPGFDKDLKESKVLLDYFVNYLIRMNGELIGDDYNFMALKYNDLRLISNAIDQSNLWYNLATMLIQSYAEKIIISGESVDARKEANLFVSLTENTVCF